MVSLIYKRNNAKHIMTMVLILNVPCCLTTNQTVSNNVSSVRPPPSRGLAGFYSNWFYPYQSWSGGSSSSEALRARTSSRLSSHKSAKISNPLVQRQVAVPCCRVKQQQSSGLAEYTGLLSGMMSTLLLTGLAGINLAVNSRRSNTRIFVVYETSTVAITETTEEPDLVTLIARK